MKNGFSDDDYSMDDYNTDDRFYGDPSDYGETSSSWSEIEKDLRSSEPFGSDSGFFGSTTRSEQKPLPWENENNENRVHNSLTMENVDSSGETFEDLRAQKDPFADKQPQNTPPDDPFSIRSDSVFSYSFGGNNTNRGVAGNRNAVRMNARATKTAIGFMLVVSLLFIVVGIYLYGKSEDQYQKSKEFESNCISVNATVEKVESSLKRSGKKLKTVYHVSVVYTYNERDYRVRLTNMSASTAKSYGLSYGKPEGKIIPVYINKNNPYDARMSIGGPDVSFAYLIFTVLGAGIFISALVIRSKNKKREQELRDRYGNRYDRM